MTVVGSGLCTRRRYHFDTFRAKVLTKAHLLMRTLKHTIQWLLLTKEGMSDYVPADENTQEAETDSSMHMTDTGNPFYHPASNPTGSGFVISDKSTKV